MKKFLMVLVCLMAGVVASCGAPKKEKKAEEGQPSKPEAECAMAADCDDSNVCTEDKCVEGDCEHTFKVCDDSDLCTTDSCDQATGCVNIVGACCPDGTVCDDSNPCTDDSCDAATGQCSSVSNAAACDDGNACTMGDVCSDGKCQKGAAKNCEDNNLCTTDFCDGNGQCVHMGECEPDTVQPPPGSDTMVGPDTEPSPDTEEPVCVPDCAGKQCGSDGCGGSCGGCVGVDPCVVASCDNGQCKGTAKNCDDKDACTTDSCDPATGDCNHETVKCDDSNVCTTDSCNAATGCQYAAVACDDKDACTVDSCEAEKGCVSAPISCDDGDKCTDDSCDAATGCEHTAKVCDDGVGCTDDLCKQGVGCVSYWVCDCESDADCNDSNPCTDDSCDPNTGCVYVNNAASCDDGNACTLGDQCSGGACLGNEAADCDDGNACTTDGCDAAVGCMHQLVVCDDGDACTTDTCAAAAGCEHAPVDCDDGNACTDDSCDAVTGCEYEANADICNDNNACTKDDACVDGFCVGQEVLCGDKNVCTDESCDPTMGCVYKAVNCDDGDPWTIDFCQPNSGCQKASTKACQVGEADSCVDGNKCTTSECKLASECKAGPFECPPAGGAYCAYEQVGCSDDNPCTLDDCDPNKGCAHTTIVGCCQTDSGCAANEKCEAGKCANIKGYCVKDSDCDDGNICTDDSCDATTTGCEHTNNTAQCNDGDALTSGDTCSFGVCSGVLATVDCDDNSDCDDGKYCNGYEKCIAGKCFGGVAPNCDDEVACTVDSCSEGNYNFSCKHVGDDSLCPSGQKCVVSYDWWYDKMGGACVECESYSDCDGGNSCITDSCNYDTGKCVHTNNTAWCDDGNPCTVSESCSNGVCSGGAVKYCNDSNECTVDSCDPTSGCKFSAFTGGGTITCGVGVCAVTVNKCQAGVKQTCTPKTPVVEVCANGLDDDCDGAVDEGCAPPPPIPPTFKVEVSCSAGACEPWIFHSADGLGLPTDTHGEGPLSATLTQKQACGGDWGFEVAVRDKTVVTWPWYGCDSAISLTTVTVKVNSVVKAGVLTKHPWACSGGGEGNLAFSKTLIGCP